MRCALLAVSLLLATLAIADDQPVPPAEAAARFKLPPGFKATLFAGEPDVVQPIAFTFDDRGRLWVVECHTYPEWSGERRDRVLILEDTDGDGRHDKRTVFLEDGKNLTSIEYGFGGIWLTSVPNLIFVPDANKDDKPDGPPVIKLDGWDLTAKHNVVNGLIWAPDGWLWGLNGILSNSAVGKPGTPDKDRMKMNCGVWRYHPVSEKVEAVAHGTTNPWGLDFDEYGEAFITNCVIKHAFHVVPGAHFERMFGQDVNPRTYQLQPSIADHIHWGGGHWTESRGGAGQHDAPGGGHAHSGAMIYLGDNWPEKYRGRLYTCNIHGSRVNQDRLEQKGSSYVAKHEPDLMLANDPWFRGLAIKYGPDGGVYVSDWSDTGECHDYDVADRSNGRIFKITYGEVKPWKEDLAKRSDVSLVGTAYTQRGWQGQHARRLIQERAIKGLADDAIEHAQHGRFDQAPRNKSEVDNMELAWLRVLWIAHSTNNRKELHNRLMEEKRPGAFRACAIRFLSEYSLSEDEQRAIIVCAKDTDPHVQLALASVAQRNAKIAKAVLPKLASNTANADDPYLPHMIWYAYEMNLDQFRDTFDADLPKFKVPLVRELMARRLTEPSETDFAENLDRLLSVIAENDDADLQRDVARGVFASLDGRRDLKAPANWRKAYEVLSGHDNSAVRDIAMKLALTFGDEQAIDDLLTLIGDKTKSAARREEAVAALAQGKEQRLSAQLIVLLDDPQLRTAALRYLPVYAAADAPAQVLSHYAKFDADTKREAIACLSSRSDWAVLLLDATEANKVAAADFTAYHWQQLAMLRDDAILKRVEKLFGNVRPTKEDRLAQIADYKQKLGPAVLKQADLKNGRAVFTKSCAACHKLFEAGGAIGPELTGAQRSNLDYVLTNVLDPSAIVPRDYQMQVVETNDGRVLVGIVKSETDAVLTLQTSTTLLKLAKTDLEARTAVPQSMMPEGLIQQLSFTDFRDLTAYLASERQVVSD